MTPTIEELQLQIGSLEAELLRLRPIEAAAREACAFLVGRRPGFAPTYARDVLLAALEPDKPRRPSGRSQRGPSRGRSK